MRLRNYYETPSQTDDNQRYSYIRLQIGDLFMNRHTKWSLRGAAVAQWTATRRPGGNDVFTELHVLRKGQ